MPLKLGDTWLKSTIFASVDCNCALVLWKPINCYQSSTTFHYAYYSAPIIFVLQVCVVLTMLEDLLSAGANDIKLYFQFTLLQNKIK